MSDCIIVDTAIGSTVTVDANSYFTDQTATIPGHAGYMPIQASLVSSGNIRCVIISIKILDDNIVYNILNVSAAQQTAKSQFSVLYKKLSVKP